VTRSRGFARGTNRRLTSWEIGAQTGVDGASQAVSSTSSTLAAGGAVSTEDGLTLIRTRGELNLFLTTSDAAGNGFHGAFALGLFNENAFLTGISSILRPLDDEAYDGWFYHRYFSLFSGGPIAAAASQDNDMVNPTSAALRIEVDSKAMRKLPEDQTIVGVLQVIELGTASMEWAFNSRTLVKLP